MKRAIAFLLAVVMVFALTACGGSASAPAASTDGAAQSAPAPAADAPAAGSKGKILYFSNLSSGVQYDFYVDLFTMMTSNLGYSFEVVYGDGFNDPATNLAAIKNAYTSDVVGIISCMDGGIQNIMEEYPDVYVVGFNSDYDSVYSTGTSAGVLGNDHFLGIMGDNFISGERLGKAYAEEVIARGYKKVSTCIFPVFAYPKHTEADATFRAAIAEYNATAAEPIEIVGDAEVLMFAPLDESYFLEPEHQDLDAIVGFCAGTLFIYPTVLNAKGSGTCPADLQIVTGGFENDPEILSDCGDSKTIVSDTIAANESAVWPMALLDAALSGNMYPDYPGQERLDSAILVINNDAKWDAIINKSPLGLKYDINLSLVNWDNIKDYFISVNPDATYAGLTEFAQSFTVEDYMK